MPDIVYGRWTGDQQTARRARYRLARICPD
jgi:hypothetical protein